MNRIATITLCLLMMAGACGGGDAACPTGSRLEAGRCIPDGADATGADAGLDTSPSDVVDSGTADGTPGDAGTDANCAEELAQCGATCVDPSTDQQHCGECDNDCGADLCFEGTCAPRDACTEALGVPCDQVIDGYFKASDPGGGDRFGTVSLSGDTLAVGVTREDSDLTGVSSGASPATNDDATDSGAVYVFRRMAATWVQEAFLKASNAESGDRFGSVSLDGNTLAVGAGGEGSDENGINRIQSNNDAANAGAVYVFERSGTSWTQQAYIKASNSDANDGFGGRVSLHDDTLAVSAASEDSNATGAGGLQSNNDARDAGAVYVFRRSAGAWTQEAYVKSSNSEERDSFGSAVAVNGDTLAVGAAFEDSDADGVGGDGSNNGAMWAGAVYVFRRSGSSWTEQAYIKASNSDAGDFFGNKVSLSGDTLAVTAQEEDGGATGVGGDENSDSAMTAGAVYVFHRSGVTWTQQAYIKASNTDALDNFGASVSLDGDTLAVGAILESSAATGVEGAQIDNTAEGAGAVYVFQRSGAVWAQTAYLKATNTDIGDRFGTFLSLSGNMLAVGAPNEDSASMGVGGDQTSNALDGSGAVYTYRIAP